MQLPRVWAEIDLDALSDNLAAVRRVLGASVDVLGVVKADAYGHGAIPIARVLEEHGVAMLGVGDSHEAVQLRQAGITTPILVLGAVVDSEIPLLVEHQITPSIHSPERVEVFERYARAIGERIGLHLLIDTGMSLLGVTPARAIDYLARIAASPHLKLEGVGTHFASPSDPEFTARQLARFERVVGGARRRGLELNRIHAASSVVLGNGAQTYYDMVRVGGLLYGLSEPADGSITPRPTLSLHSQVVHLRDVDAGTPVSYGGTFVTSRRTRLATLAVGYHDGYLHHLSNRAEVLIRGRRAPVVGRVTMDYTLVDVTDVPGAAVGDRVVLLGRDGDASITGRDLAAWASTIEYEIPSHLGPRVRRVYVRNGRSALQTESTLPSSREPVRRESSQPILNASPGAPE
ncbi:MAG: alanine racemase [Planctomycetes bacterium]|nr:alanine racemase [Planctomycetota bacterium]